MKSNISDYILLQCELQAAYLMILAAANKSGAGIPVKKITFQRGGSTVERWIDKYGHPADAPGGDKDTGLSLSSPRDMIEKIDNSFYEITKKLKGELEEGYADLTEPIMEHIEAEYKEFKKQLLPVYKDFRPQMMKAFGKQRARYVEQKLANMEILPEEFKSIPDAIKTADKHRAKAFGVAAGIAATTLAIFVPSVSIVLMRRQLVKSSPLFQKILKTTPGIANAKEAVIDMASTGGVVKPKDDICQLLLQSLSESALLGTAIELNDELMDEAKVSRKIGRFIEDKTGQKVSHEDRKTIEGALNIAIVCAFGTSNVRQRMMVAATQVWDKKIDDRVKKAYIDRIKEKSKDMYFGIPTGLYTFLIKLGIPPERISALGKLTPSELENQLSKMCDDIYKLKGGGESQLEKTKKIIEKMI